MEWRAKSSVELWQHERATKRGLQVNANSILFYPYHLPSQQSQVLPSPSANPTHMQ